MDFYSDFYYNFKGTSTQYSHARQWRLTIDSDSAKFQSTACQKTGCSSFRMVADGSDLEMINFSSISCFAIILMNDLGFDRRIYPLFYFAYLFIFVYFITSLGCLDWHEFWTQYISKINRQKVIALNSNIFSPISNQL